MKGTTRQLRKLVEAQRQEIVELKAQLEAFAGLKAALDAALARIAALEAERKEDKARIIALEAQLGQNSSNSSKPPSTDPPGTPPKKRMRKSKGRKPGGQPGHEYHGRKPVPPEQVTEVVEVEPGECVNGCGEFEGDARRSKPRLHQVLEIPPIVLEVIEYQLFGRLCPKCGRWTWAELPPGVPSRGEGPRLTALVALLNGKYRLAKRQVQEALSDILGVDLSLGTICNLGQEMSDALDAPVEEARQYVRRQWLAYLDETGWKQGQENGRKKRAWLWVAATAMVTVFQVATSRGSKIAKQMLGEEFAGFIVTDRWGGYNWVDAARRQICWSHLIRDFQGFADRGGRGGEIGEELLDQVDKMFDWWHRVRDGTLDRATFQAKMKPVEATIIGLLHKAKDLDDSDEHKTRGMANMILKLDKALFTFVKVEGIEPTNNFGERQVRPGAMWRRTSFGTQSEAGSRFVERMLTTAATLRQQKRCVLEFLTEAYAAHLAGRPGPSLLP